MIQKKSQDRHVTGTLVNKHLLLLDTICIVVTMSPQRYTLAKLSI